MAEFLSQDEIDYLLNIAEEGDTSELSQEHKIIEILNFSADLVDSIQNKNRVKVILECTKIINYIDSYIKEYNLNISDLMSYNYKSKEDEFCIKMPRSSEESNERLSNSSTRGKMDLFSAEHFTEKLKYEDVFKDEDTSVKLCYSLKELEDPCIFQESLDVLNRLEVDVMTGSVKLKENK